MDLTLTRRGDYVVRAAILLASRWNGDGGFTKIREVAEAMRLHQTRVNASEAIRSSLATTSRAEVVAVDHRLGRGVAIADVLARHRPRDHTHGKRSTGR